MRLQEQEEQRRRLRPIATANASTGLPSLVYPSERVDGASGGVGNTGSGVDVGVGGAIHYVSNDGVDVAGGGADVPANASAPSLSVADDDVLPPGYEEAVYYMDIESGVTEAPSEGRQQRFYRAFETAALFAARDSLFLGGAARRAEDDVTIRDVREGAETPATVPRVTFEDDDDNDDHVGDDEDDDDNNNNNIIVENNRAAGRRGQFYIDFYNARENGHAPDQEEEREGEGEEEEEEEEDGVEEEEEEAEGEREHPPNYDHVMSDYFRQI